MTDAEKHTAMANAIRALAMDAVQVAKSGHTCEGNGPQCNEYKNTLLATVKYFTSRLGFDAMVRTDRNDDHKAQNEDEPKCLFVFHECGDGLTIDYLVSR